MILTNPGKLRVYKLLFFLYLCLSGAVTHGISQPRQAFLRFMFYNVENFFDTEDDPLTGDDEYTPEGAMRWTRSKYIAKRNNIFKVIANVGGWDPPALIALCEIENRKTINDLIRNTPLGKYPYRIIHQESPDFRGIDVCLLYREDLVQLIDEQYIAVKLKDEKKYSRDILYATMLTAYKDTLHFFVNHWPSRSGGQKKSEHARKLAASYLRQKVDSIFTLIPNANIVITGDMNDGPFDKSITKELKVHTDTLSISSSTLYNLTAFKEGETTGTIKFQGRWFLFDQVIVSGAMLRPSNNIFVNQCHIFRESYLLEHDKRYSGVKPFRTNIGPRYNKGYSDHLPVYFDIYLRKDH